MVAGLQPNGSVLVQCLDDDGNVLGEVRVEKDEVPRITSVQAHLFHHPRDVAISMAKISLSSSAEAGADFVVSGRGHVITVVNYDRVVELAGIDDLPNVHDDEICLTGLRSVVSLEEMRRRQSGRKNASRSGLQPDGSVVVLCLNKTSQVIGETRIGPQDVPRAADLWVTDHAILGSRLWIGVGQRSWWTHVARINVGVIRNDVAEVAGLDALPNLSDDKIDLSNLPNAQRRRAALKASGPPPLIHLEMDTDDGDDDRSDAKQKDRSAGGSRDLCTIKNLTKQLRREEERRATAEADVRGLHRDVARLQAKVKDVARDAKRIDHSLLDFGGEQRTLLGRGGAAKVYAATFNGASVAVKELVCDKGGALVEKAVEDELALVSRVTAHPHVVSVFGVTRGEHAVALVMERLDTSLYKLLHGDSGDERALTAIERLRVGAAVSHALAFCHGLAPPVLHRDVKSGNVLVSADLRDVKLSDFGASRLGSAVSNMTANVGTTQWTAPEVLAGEHYDAKADVYSLGVLVWELYAGEVPFAHLNMPAMQIGVQVLVNKLRPEPARPASMPELVAMLVHRCWADAVALRPTSAQAAHELDQQLAAGVALEQDKRLDETLCVVCVDAPRTHVLVPCGHRFYCAECASGLYECAMCRMVIQERQQVFL